MRASDKDRLSSGSGSDASSPQISYHQKRTESSEVSSRTHQQFHLYLFARHAYFTWAVHNTEVFSALECQHSPFAVSPITAWVSSL